MNWNYFEPYPACVKALNLCLVFVFVFAANLNASTGTRGMLGENYISAGFGTTIFDQDDSFDSREHSLIIGGQANINVAPHVDINMAFAHEQVDFDDDFDLRHNSIFFSAVLFGTMSEHIRPYINAGAGGQHFEIRFPGVKFSDTTYRYGFGGGIEIQMFPKTTLDVGLNWSDRGKLKDLDITLPEEQSITTSGKLSHYISESVSISGMIVFENGVNDTTFGGSLNYHF